MASLRDAPRAAPEPAWVHAMALRCSLPVQRRVWGCTAEEARASAEDGTVRPHAPGSFGEGGGEFHFQNLCRAVLTSGEWRREGGGTAFIPSLGEADHARLDAIAEHVELRPSNIEGAGSGVFARRALPAGFLLPYVGVIRINKDAEIEECAYRLALVEDTDSWVIDGDPGLLASLGIDETRSFATRVNESPAGFPRLRPNCVLSTYEAPEWAHLTPAAIYTSRKIAPGEELFTSYGEDYEEVRGMFYPERVTLRK